MSDAITQARAQTGAPLAAPRPGMTAQPVAPARQGVAIALENIRHRFGGSTVIDRLDLSIAGGELVALLGPSGCGKSTLLRIVAGLLGQTEGTVRVGGQSVDHLSTSERGAGIVFQSYALFPHMSVEDNVAYGLRARGIGKSSCVQTVTQMLEMVRMAAFRKRYPRELSGGQQQRVALARTLAVQPKLLLLDEPFAALDKNLRLDMQIEIKRIQRELGITTLMVTHDQEEAMSMADRLAVMNAGRIEQFDTPEAIYDTPASLFVASFVGTANLLPGRLARQTGGSFSVACAAGGQIALPHAAPCSRNGGVVLAARPEHLLIGSPSDTAIDAVIEMALPIGASVLYELSLADGMPIKITQPRQADTPRFEVGQRVGVRLRADSPVSVFAA
jgi:putative spermidine/putrescine transport system ATP-binding protein